VKCLKTKRKNKKKNNCNIKGDMLSHLISTPPNENPSTAKCWFEKSTNCKVLDPKKQPTAVWTHSSWWIFRKGTSQLVDFSEKHFAAGGFLLGGIENFPQLWGKYRMETHPQKEWPLFVQEVSNVTSLSLQAYYYFCHEGPLCGCKHRRSSFYTFPAIIAENFMFQQYI